MPVLSRYKEGVSWGQNAGQEWGLSELGKLLKVGVFHINLAGVMKNVRLVRVHCLRLLRRIQSDVLPS